MNVKMRLLVVPSLLAAGLLGACGPQDGNQGAGVSTPGAAGQDQVVVATPDTASQDQAGVTEGDTGDITTDEEQAGVATSETTTEDQAGVTEGDTGDITTDEEQAGVATSETTTEDQAGVATTPDAASQDQAGAATTPDAATEDQAGVATTPDAATEEQAGAATMPGMGQFDMMSAYKASEFIGYHVQNPQGEDLGEIEDLMVDPSTSQVRYAVLSFGGFLDIGDKLFAIPLDAIQFNPDEQAFILDVDQERLEQAPSFDESSWPDTANPDWDMGYSDFWLDGMNNNGATTEDQAGAATTPDAATEDQADVATTPDAATEDQASAETTPDAATEDQAGVATTPDAASQDQAATGDQDTMTDQPMAGSVLRASELLDYEIYNAQGEEIGEVEDLIVQMGGAQQQQAQPQQHMVYAVLSLDNMAIDTTGQTGDTAQSGDTATQTDDQAGTDATAGQTDDTVQSDDVAQSDAAVQTDVTGQQEARFYAIPLSNLQLSPDEENVFVFNADPQMLDTALSFTPDEWSNQMNLEDVN